MPSFRSVAPRRLPAHPAVHRRATASSPLRLAAAALAAPRVRRGAAAVAGRNAEDRRGAIAAARLAARDGGRGARDGRSRAASCPIPKLKAGVENVPTRRRRRLVADARLHDDVEDRPDAGIPGRRQAAAQGRARRARRRAWRRRRRRRDARRRARRRHGVVRAPLRGGRRARDRRADRRGRAQRRRPSPRRIAPARRRRASSSPRRAWWSSSGTARPKPRRRRSARGSCSRATSAPAAERPLGDAPDVARLPEAARLADVDAQPELRLAKAQESVAAAEAALAGAAKRPDWSAEISYAVRGSPYSNMVSLMFSIDLPWSAGTRQDREHAAKLRELDAARAMREDTQRMRSGGSRVRWSPNGNRPARRRSASKASCFRLPRNAATRRRPPIAAAPARSPRCSTRAAPSSTPSSRSSPSSQAAAKAWAWLNFVTPAAEGS